MTSVVCLFSTKNALHWLMGTPTFHRGVVYITEKRLRTTALKYYSRFSTPQKTLVYCTEGHWYCHFNPVTISSDHFNHGHSYYIMVAQVPPLFFIYFFLQWLVEAIVKVRVFTTLNNSLKHHPTLHLSPYNWTLH